MTRRQKKNLARIVLSAAMLAVVSFLPLEDVWKLLAYLVPYLLSGWDVLWGAARNIARGQVFDEEFLMALATIGALALADYREAVAVMVFYQTGEWFQGIAVGKSRRNIARLMDIRPDTANLIRDGEEVCVSPEEVQVGDVIVVRPGEKIPLDGQVLEGETTVDTAALTGESLPRDVKVGDRVVSGSICLTGVIRIRVESKFSESTVSRILELVENASEKKARVENFITRFSRYYTPIVVSLAALLAVLPPLVGFGTWGEWIRRALIFLVVSCPCALVVSVPLSFFGGIGGASRAGILIKGAGYLEMLSKARIAVFDKTGTLTCGRFAVSCVIAKAGSEEEILRFAAHAEANSSHPIARSVVMAYGREIAQDKVKNVLEKSGKGVIADVEGRRVAVGNPLLMLDEGVDVAVAEEAGTRLHVAVDGEYRGEIVLRDELKPGAKQAIEDIRREGVRKVVILTGDRGSEAGRIAEELGADEVRAELLPQDKVAEVEKLLGDEKVLFVGDGINDAPVLTRSDVGIAMGAMGSDAAIEAADIVLMDDDPAKVARAILVAKKTMGIVKQNIAFALSVKGIVMALGAVGIANMWLAVFADVGVLVLAILNAMRALGVGK